MEIQHLRHATFILTVSGRKLIVDPMLDKVHTRPPIKLKRNETPNPTVELPYEDKKLGKFINSLDGIIITHTHSDHYDATAKSLLPKSIPLFCQPEDQNKLAADGFLNIIPVNPDFDWKELRFTRTRGRHGHGVIRYRMGCVSGFVIHSKGEPTLYIAGDTVWCPEVEKALEKHNPDVIIVYAGAARFDLGKPITMTSADILKVCQKAPNSRVVAIHMEAINHCGLTREALGHFLAVNGLTSRVLIPKDGEVIKF
ncbi:MAG: MBL fold metallo-hydrolase [Clostridia bacterium]|nr:MBL fold metallo-hydrolase [Clostridia bacterium]